MKFAIIITTPDFAGLNIKERLLENYDFIELDKKFNDYNIFEYKKSKDVKIYTTDKRCVYCENFDKKINSDLFMHKKAKPFWHPKIRDGQTSHFSVECPSNFMIFPTTHRSEAGIRSLSCHTQGNWGKAELGGKDRTLGIAPAIYLKEFFKELNIQGKDLNYDVTLETTHHGPEISKPAVFLEIGTSERQWKDKKAALAIAETIMGVITKKYNEKYYKSCILLGGGHYNQTANKLMLNTEFAVGHICPKYALEDLDEEMLKQAIEKTTPKPELVILDWKGLGQYKQKIINLLEKMDLKYERYQRLKEE